MHGKLVGAVAALGVLGGVAAGVMGDGERLFFVVSNDLSPSQPAATVTLWTSFDPGDYCFSGVHTTVAAGDGLWGGPGLLAPLDGPGTSAGALSPDGRRVEHILAGQLHWPHEFFGDPSNPIAIWRGTLSIDDFTPREIDLSTITRRYDVYIRRDTGQSRSALPTLAEAAGTIAVVPAPGSLAVLGLGLAMGRRRRGRACPSGRRPCVPGRGARGPGPAGRRGA